jgi:hypothetical protein
MRLRIFFSEPGAPGASQMRASSGTSMVMVGWKVMGLRLLASVKFMDKLRLGGGRCGVTFRR